MDDKVNPTFDSRKDPIYSGHFISINDVVDGDCDRWQALLNKSTYTQGQLFHELLDAYYEKYINNDNEEVPDHSIDDDTHTTGNAFIKHSFTTVSIRPENGSETRIFDQFKVKTEITTQSNHKNLRIIFTDINPKIDCKSIKLDCIQYGDVLKEVFTSDLTKQPEAIFDVLMDKYPNPNGLEIRVFYEVHDYQVE